MANYYVTTTGAGTNSGADWDNAFDWAAFASQGLSAGDSVYFAGGTYSVSAGYSNASDGAYRNHISLIGVSSGTTNEPPTMSDWATGTDRPLINTGSNSFVIDNSWRLSNLRFTSSNATYSLVTDTYTIIQNCKISNTAVSLSRCLNMHSGTLYNSEIECTDGDGLWTGLTSNIIMCLFHGGDGFGIGCNGNTGSVIGNIVYDFPTGIGLYTVGEFYVAHNTVYEATTYGIDATQSGGNIIINNTLSGCGTGIAGSTSYPQALIDYNNYYNNTTDVSNVSKGPNAMAVNPNFTDAASGDFSLASASDLIGAGLGIQLGVG
jgi:parallel beta-helix repeat protein